MAAAENKKSFWEIFAIVVGAIAALITAIAALLAALNGGAAKEKDAPLAAAQAAPSKSQPAYDAEAERLKAEAAEARAKAAELERKLAEAEEKKTAIAVALSVPKQGDTDTITDEATGMKLVYVPRGCFKMGSSSDDEDHQKDEGPVHEVCVDGFYMGKQEVTQGQWEKVMGSNPAKFQKGGNYPVESVSWNDTQDFIKKLNSRTGKKYRLPTEAEWEYACRANGSGKYCGGDDVDAVAWYDKNSGGGTHPVGGKKANAFGLHDMSGNVWEWCADWDDGGYYASSPKDNPTGPKSGLARVIRGGSWSFAPDLVRAAGRLWYAPGNRGGSLGFRLVLPVR